MKFLRMTFLGEFSSCHPERSEGSEDVHVSVHRFFVTSLLRMTRRMHAGRNALRPYMWMYTDPSLTLRMTRKKENPHHPRL